MPDLNPIHWLLVGCVVLLVGCLGYAGVTKMQLRASEGQFRGFVAETEAKASVQALENWKESAKRDKITQELELKHVEVKNDRDRKYSAYRLLNSNAGRSAMPSVPISPECRENGSEQAIVARAVAELETRVLGILQQGDKGIDAAVIHEEWEEMQTKVLVE